MTGFELRLWRRGLGWTQERAAEELDISLRSYITYEHRSPPKIVALAALAIERKADKSAKPDFLSWRKEQNITQKTAAEMLDISLRSYICYERGTPPHIALLALQALSVRSQH